MFDGVDTYSYDFTTDAGKAYGVNAQIEVAPGIFGMIPGDSFPDGFINETDKDPTWTSQAGKPGYLRSDLNLDGQAENTDKNDHWRSNIGKGICVPN